jgi:uncharacterized protein YndB with AHSA1/START domain
MARVQRIIKTSPDRVFAALADGWTYSDWVVGTAHIRDVDADWPAVGALLHHTVGPWPLSLSDTSRVLSADVDRQLTLKVMLWPLGEATVRIELEPAGPGATRVTMYEQFRAGPLHWVQNKINDLALHRRNVESLRRLADLAEHEKAGRAGPAGA